MTALVRSVINSSTRRGSMLCVAGSTSQNTGVIPSQRNPCAVEIKVKEGRITSPERSSVLTATSRPIVALQRATQCLTPINWQMRRSNSCNKGPSFVNHLLSRRSLTRCKKVSRSPIFGRPTCNSSRKAGGPPKMARSSIRDFTARIRLAFLALSNANHPELGREGNSRFCQQDQRPRAHRGLCKLPCRRPA